MLPAMNWQNSQPSDLKIREFLTCWIRPKGLCGIKGHLTVDMFPGQRWWATIYGALNGILAEVH
jgi:hypothetical protein